MRIVLDAFGTDDCPVPDVAGAVMAAREWPEDEIILAGPEDRLKAELAKHNTAGLKITIKHAPDIITMHHHSDAVRNMTESSIRVGMKMVKDGEADAFVSMGNTIACLSAAIFDLRRIRGIRRPGLCIYYPLAPNPAVFIDTGATADPKPEILEQFAEMACIYAEKVLGIENPRVGLLANGEEEEKGSMVMRETFAVLKESDLNFVGNIEPKEATKGFADVVVTDGFTGNIHIKTAEAVASYLKRLVKEDLLGGPLPKVALVLMLPGLILALPGLLLMLPGLRKMLKQLDYAETGGGLLMGVNGVVIVGHGRSNARAVRSGILRAREAVANNIVPTIKEELAKKRGA